MANSIELKAVELVMKYEKKQGRKPQKVSKNKDYPFDVESGNRYIEVKGTSSKCPSFVWLYKKLLKKLGDDLLKYWIYVFYDINQESKLRMLPPEKIFGNLEIGTMFVLPGRVVKDKEIKDVVLTKL